MRFIKRLKVGKYDHGFVSVRDGVATVTALPNGGQSFTARFRGVGTLTGAARLSSVATAVKALGVDRDFGPEDYGGYSLVTVDAEHAAPELEPATGQTTVVNGPKFMATWDWAEVAVATEKSRFGFMGIMVDGSTVVGTDGKRLHYAEVDGMSIPKSLMPLVVGTFLREFGDGNVRITVGADRVTIDAGFETLTAMLVEGQYPDYRAVIPKESGTRVPMSPIAEHVRKAKVFTSVDSRAVRIENVGHAVVVRAQSPDIGRYDADTGVEAEIVPVAFNPDHFVDACPRKSAPTISWSSGKQPATVDVGDGRRAVLMPITLRNA